MYTHFDIIRLDTSPTVAKTVSARRYRIANQTVPVLSIGIDPKKGGLKNALQMAPRYGANIVCLPNCGLKRLHYQQISLCEGKFLSAVLVAALPEIREYRCNKYLIGFNADSLYGRIYARIIAPELSRSVLIGDKENTALLSRIIYRESGVRPAQSGIPEIIITPPNEVSLPGIPALSIEQDYYLLEGEIVSVHLAESLLFAITPPPAKSHLTLYARQLARNYHLSQMYPLSPKDLSKS